MEISTSERLLPEIKTLFKFRVVLMPVFVSACFFLHILFEGAFEVNPGLIGQANEHPKNIRHFIFKMKFFSGFRALFTVLACHDPGKFPYFFHQDGSIGQFRKIADANGFNPLVNLFLCVFKADAFHSNLYFCLTNHGILNRTSLINEIRSKKSFLCVGLDSDILKMPEGIGQNAQGLIDFNKAIIEATADYAVSYKVNTAFYESLGAKGWDVMEKTLEFIPKNIFTIADAKRGDIGNTSSMYARAFFDNLSFDSITINPYMGKDSVSPFLDFEGKWSILLALTSNPGSQDFQTLQVGNEQVFEEVLRKSSRWGSANNMMYVVGATRAEQLEKIRSIIPDHFLLVPGVGAQGGSLEQVVKYGANKDIGLLINASRSIIYASSGKDFAQAAAKEAAAMQAQMEQYVV